MQHLLVDREASKEQHPPRRRRLDDPRDVGIFEREVHERGDIDAVYGCVPFDPLPAHELFVVDAQVVLLGPIQLQVPG